MLIGELAALTGASRRSLRHYEDEGLLTSARAANGYRTYDAPAVATVHKIKALLGAGMTLDLDVDKQNELFDVARAAWAEAGKKSPHLATSFWFAMGDGDEAREQVHSHLLRYMNWIPAEYVDAMAPTTGWAGTEGELLEVLRRFDAIGADEIHLIPTSSDVDQIRRVADVVKDFESQRAS